MPRLMSAVSASLLLFVVACGDAALTRNVQPGASWEPASGLPLEEPEQIFSENGVLEVNLTGRLRTIDVSGSPIVARPYHEEFVGPTLNVSPGDTIRVTLRNDTNMKTNIHYHGLHVSPSGRSDNVFRHVHPHTKVISVVDIPDNHEVGTFWYHVHYHGNTEPQVAGGMSGLIVMEGLEDRLPAELQDITQRQIALSDIQDKDGRVVMQAGQIDPSKPTTRLVDGQLMPTMSLAPGETQLWRIANIGADMFYDVALEGHQFHVIAQDAFPVWEVWSADHLLLPPGQRFDVLVQGGDAGTYSLKTRKYDQGFMAVVAADLATVQVTGDAQEPSALPTSMNTMDAALDDATIAKERRFVFSFGDFSKPGWAQINGKAFDEDRVDVSPHVGTVEKWTLVNKTPEDHPFHIHVNDFQVMKVNGEPYDAKGLQDVVLLPKHGKVVIRNPFLDFTGEFVFHCHILGHEDNGMMQSVKVR